MRASERVQLIKAIAGRLSKDSWPHIDLTLKQFDLPALVSFEGNAEEYVIRRVEDASDDKLVELGDHLGLLSLPTSAAAEPAFWLPGHFRLFLSHVAAHKSVVTALRTALRSHLVSGFVAHEDIEPTQEWQNEIERALNTADGLAALITSDFHLSKWTDQEVGAAMGRGIVILSLKYGADPYGFIGKYQALPIVGKQHDAIALEVFKLLANHPLSRARLSECVVSSFESAWSWENARRDMSLLEQFSYLDRYQLDRIASAPSTNAKVKESWGVPDRVTRLDKLLRPASA